MTAAKRSPEARDDVIAAWGEKRLIAEVIRPAFSGSAPYPIGDDCAAFDIPSGHLVVTSTDRVPADLVAFRTGVIDHRGLGRYLAGLNISDIAASGATPRGLLLNFGLPQSMPVTDLKALCEGIGEVAARWECPVIGGDLSSASELCLSATSFGSILPEERLTRRGARPGDTVFVSRPIGLTPAAMWTLLEGSATRLLDEDRQRLEGQFALPPMVELGLRLSASLECSACMDNTDGLGQSLSEIAAESRARIVLSADRLALSAMVNHVAGLAKQESVDFALGPGADFSLIGALRGAWSQADATARFGPEVRTIGVVEAGDGLFVEDLSGRRPIEPRGWNYFSAIESAAARSGAAIERALAPVAQQ